MKANKNKFVLNTECVGKLLKSDELRDALGKFAGEIAGRAGDGYDHDTKMESTRVIASVYTTSAAAAREDSNNNTLLKAVY